MTVPPSFNEVRIPLGRSGGIRRRVNLDPVNEIVEHIVRQNFRIPVFLQKCDKPDMICLFRFKVAVLLKLGYPVFKLKLLRVVLRHHPLKLPVWEPAGHVAFI